MEMETLKELYVDELKDLYSAENQILKALPKMIKKATHPQLKKAFAAHERQTQQHVKRLERICKSLGESPKGKKCKGMEGVIQDGAELMQEDAADDVMDAGLITAAQHVEHYEMAGYGTVRTWARELGLEDHANLLQQTLDEERNTDELLTEIAVSAINLEAVDGDNGEGEGGGGKSSRLRNKKR
ncbi:MAG: ferritin-like domain-containing protein [Gemmatimonadota bacterium]|nr:ferritin-like domain-containing protein [Gemmatimonadota bacterium]